MDHIDRRQLIRGGSSLVLGLATTMEPTVQLLKQLQKHGVIQKNADGRLNAEGVLIGTAVNAGTGVPLALLYNKYLPLALKCLQDKVRSDAIEKDIATSITNIKETYGVHVHFEIDNLHSFLTQAFTPDFAWKILSPFIRRQALENLSECLAAYPPELIKKNVQHVHIVDYFMHFDRETNQWRSAGGQARYDNRHARITIHQLKPAKQAERAFLGTEILYKDAVHHEFAHLMTRNALQENEWKKLHPTFVYAKSVKPEVMYKEIPNFARGYGTKDYLEDIATVAEELFKRNSTVWHRMADDSILSAKIAYMQNWYAQETQGMSFEMNKDYWARGGKK